MTRAIGISSHVTLQIVKDRTVVMVTHTEDADETGSVRKVVLDHMRVWYPSHAHPMQMEELEEHIAAVSAEYGRARLVYDPREATGTAQNLRDERRHSGAVQLHDIKRGSSRVGLESGHSYKAFCLLARCCAHQGIDERPTQGDGTGTISSYAPEQKRS